LAIVTDFDTLATEVASYLDRSDLTTHIPNFIEACENKLYRSLEIRGLEVAFSETVSSGVIALSGVTRYRNPKYLYVNSNPITPLNFVSLETLYRQYSNRSQTSAKPTLIAREAGNLIFGPVAADTVVVKGVYYEQLANLSTGGTTTNWFTDNYPELLLYGSLTQAEPFIADDPRIVVWRAMYDDALSTLMELETRESRGGGSLQIRVG